MQLNEKRQSNTFRCFRESIKGNNQSIIFCMKPFEERYIRMTDY